MTGTTNLTFDDADVVVNTNGGRNKEFNPYTDVIAAIALKTNPETGKPVAKKFVLTTPKDESDKTALARVRRQLSDAGKNNDPSVSVQVRDEATGTGTNAITFWTIKRIVKTVKPAEVSA
jgi:hypothetical protein